MLVGNAPLSPRVIALLDPVDPLPVAELLQIPLHGCCFKAEINDNLLHLVRAVAGGAAFMSLTVLTHQPAPTIRSVLAELGVVLTEQEEKIVSLLIRGLTNDAIAVESGLADQTVRNYVKSIYSKLGTNNRAEIVARFQGVVGISNGK